MEGAMRLVTRSVAVTLTLTMVASTSGEVTTKSAGNSWDSGTPTLLTVLFLFLSCNTDGRAQTKVSTSFLSSFFCKERERRRDRRTEHADSNRLEFLEKCFPSRVIHRCKVDNERLGLYASTATATCVDYIFIHSITHCIYEEEQALEEQRECDQAPEKRACCYFTAANSGDCCVRMRARLVSSSLHVICAEATLFH
jgi:hypothetical protein